MIELGWYIKIQFDNHTNTFALGYQTKNKMKSLIIVSLQYIQMFKFPNQKFTAILNTLDNLP